jgi:hypothetical protein
MAAECIAAAILGIVFRRVRLWGRWVVSFAVVAIGVSVEAADAASNDAIDAGTTAWRIPANDGVNCLYLFLRLQGCSVSYDDILRQRARNIGELRDLARNYGLPAEVYRCGPANLSGEDFPVISHFDASGDAGAGEFVLVVGTGINRGKPKWLLVRGGSVVMEDWPDDDFRRAWSGCFLACERQSRWRSSLIGLGGGIFLVVGYAGWRWARRPCGARLAGTTGLPSGAMG